MIPIKTPREIEIMREACRISAIALKEAAAAVAVGVSTDEISDAFEEACARYGAHPNCRGTYGFEKACCVSVNDELIHGCPSRRRLRNGDIVSIDGGAEFGGFNGDNALTIPVGKVNTNTRRLADTARKCFEAALASIKPGARVVDISRAIQTTAEAAGFGVCRKFTGHGVGKELHESPEIPCFVSAGKGPKLRPGMTLAIEPMITMGHYDVGYAPDGFTVITMDGRLCAHHEHTVLVTENGAEVLTKI